MLSNKRSDLYFTISDDERKALAVVERIEQHIRSKNPRQSPASRSDSLDHGGEKSFSGAISKRM